MSDRNWLCLDCGKNTFDSPSDYYMLRNCLWRTLVPRNQRHGMLCLTCVEQRLGRSLLPTDFRSGLGNEADSDDEPMTRADYGIIDTLTTETLQDIDAALLSVAASSPHSVGGIVMSVMESQVAVPGLPDWFYIERVGHLIDSKRLTIVEKHEVLLKCKVQSTERPRASE